MNCFLFDSIVSFNVIGHSLMTTWVCNFSWYELWLRTLSKCVSIHKTQNVWRSFDLVPHCFIVILNIFHFIFYEAYLSWLVRTASIKLISNNWRSVYSIQDELCFSKTTLSFEVCFVIKLWINLFATSVAKFSFPDLHVGIVDGLPEKMKFAIKGRHHKYMANKLTATKLTTCLGIAGWVTTSGYVSRVWSRDILFACFITRGR